MTGAVAEPRFNAASTRRVALRAAAAGGVITGITAIFDLTQVCRGYLASLVFLLGLSVGSLGLKLIHSVTGGNWGEQLRPSTEAAARTLWLLLLLWLPLFFVLPHIYPWATGSPGVHFQHQYLDLPFFMIRALACAAIWLVLIHVNRTYAHSELLNGLGLVAYMLTVTVFAVDWVMSIDAPWTSTLFPVLIAAGQALAATALGVLVATSATPDAQALEKDSRRDLGNLLMMFVLVWAYLSVSQYLLVWSANLAEEIPWYLRRLRGGWEWIALLLVIMQFALPFALLLSRSIKQHISWLGGVAALVLAMRWFEAIWWVEAQPVRESAWFWLSDLATLGALGGIWVWDFLRHLEGASARAA